MKRLLELPHRWISARLLWIETEKLSQI